MLYCDDVLYYDDVCRNTRSLVRMGDVELTVCCIVIMCVSQRVLYHQRVLRRVLQCDHVCVAACVVSLSCVCLSLCCSVIAACSDLIILSERLLFVGKIFP